MRCPRCTEPMSIVLKKDVEIDFCPNCQGIWLDKGELEKIIGQLGDHYSNKSNYKTDYDNYDYGDPDYATHHPNRRRKTFLDNFFDF